MHDSWQEHDRSRRDERDRGPVAFGLILIILGVAFFVAQQTGIDWGKTGWPLFVIVPGIALLLLGFSIGGEGGLGAAIPGGIVTSVGLLLAFQESTNTYASWAYAWALVAPGSVGVTLLLYGIVHRRGDLVDAGWRTAAVGAVLFVAFGLFFENVIGIDSESNTTLMRDAMPFLAVGLGALIVLANLIPAPRRESRGPWTPPDHGAAPPDRATAPGSPEPVTAPPSTASPPSTPASSAAAPVEPASPDAAEPPQPPETPAT